MKRVVVLLLIISPLFFSCKKVQEQVAQDYLMTIMTTGYWKMNNYTENGIDITTQWDGYLFKFNTDYSVNAMKNSATFSTGSWYGSITDTTFSANFPASANDTLRKLNGNWKWNDSSPTYVKATHKVRNDKLYLIKQ